MIEYSSDQGVKRYTYLDNLRLMYGYDHVSADFQAVCSCFTVSKVRHFKTTVGAEAWLEKTFNEFKNCITADNKYFIYELECGDIILGEFDSGQDVCLNKLIILALYKGFVE